MRLYKPVTFIALLLLGTLSYCSQPAQEQEMPATNEQHIGHNPVKEEGRLTIKAQPEQDSLKGSLKAEAHGQIGNAHLTINYHSPAVRGRMIWGGLVAYDQVWVTGAHSATSLTSDNDIMVGGELLPAGKYALFTIPGKDEWVFIINKNWEQHLADDYAASDDVVRIKVKPQAVEQHQERLRYEVTTEKEHKGSIVISWDKLKIAVPVSAVEK